MIFNKNFIFDIFRSQFYKKYYIPSNCTISIVGNLKKSIVTDLNKVFTNRRDIIVADTIIALFRMRENIENFNKKALYILIRERTGLKTQNITKVINIMKRDYAKMWSIYNKTGRLVDRR